MHRIQTGVLLIATGLLLRDAESTYGQASGCKPPTDTTPPSRIRLDRGEYRLTLVGAAGRWKSRSTTGRLWLWPTSSMDRSPRTGQVAVGDTAKTPFYGAVEKLDFEKVGAPVSDDAGTTPASSRDPVFPGVLVLTDAPEHEATNDGVVTLDQVVLTIGTVSNERTELDVTDGAGIGLWVRHADSTGFSGTWDNWGIVVGGNGYYCAVRVGPTPPGP
jgi:hypothetical protein